MSLAISDTRKVIRLAMPSVDVHHNVHAHLGHKGGLVFRLKVHGNSHVKDIFKFNPQKGDCEPASKDGGIMKSDGS